MSDNPNASRKNSAVALSHVALAATGVYSLVRARSWQWSACHITFGIITINNSMATYGCLTDDGEPETGLYVYTAYLQLLFALPCINTTVWILRGYQRDICWAWAVIPVFPIAIYLISGEIDSALVEIIIIINLIGLGKISLAESDNYGLAAVVAFTIAHFFVRRIASYNFAICLFTYFSLRAVGVAQGAISD